MADNNNSRELVLSSLLCFVINTRRKYPNKVIKSIVTDYYDLDAICTAKERLCKDIDTVASAIAIKVPRTRRNSDNKVNIIVEDILSILDLLDDSGVLLSLPRYVTDNFCELPLVRVDTDAMSTILSNLVEIKEAVNTIGLGCVSGRSRPVVVTDQIKPSDTECEISQDEEMVGGHSWGSVTSEAFQEPAHNLRKKRRLQRKSSFSPQPISNSVVHVPVADPGERSTAVKQNTAVPSVKKSYLAAAQDGQLSNKKYTRIVGRANTTNSQTVLKSAKPYVKKLVYGVYNIDSEETVESVAQFVTDICGVKPITCFRVGQSKPVDDSNLGKSLAFRICINAEYNDKFLNPDVWYNGIVIRKWRFKPKTASEGPDKSIPNNA